MHSVRRSHFFNSHSLLRWLWSTLLSKIRYEMPLFIRDSWNASANGRKMYRRFTRVDFIFVRQFTGNRRHESQIGKLWRELQASRTLVQKCLEKRSLLSTVQAVMELFRYAVEEAAIVANGHNRRTNPPKCAFLNYGRADLKISWELNFAQHSYFCPASILFYSWYGAVRTNGEMTWNCKHPTVK